MSGIEDLKQGSSNNRVDIGGNAPVRRPKTIIQPRSYDSADRVPVDVNQIAPKEEEKEIPGVTTMESPVKAILEGENSPFANFLTEKRNEAQEYMASKELEKEIEEDFDDEDTEEFEVGSGSSAIDTNWDNRSFDGSVDEDKAVVVEDDLFEEEKVDVDSEEDTVQKSDSDLHKEDEVETPDIDLEVSNYDAPLELEENEDDEDVVSSQEDVLKHLQNLATERLKPISQTLNISSFTIAKKPTRNIKTIEKEQVKAAKWVLPTQESVVLMKEFLGSELESLREVSEDSTNVSMLFRKFRMIYDHIVSAKPDSYETWLKSTPYADIDHYFFAVYISSFKGSNYLPIDCKQPKCNETFLTEDIPILDMVKFADDRAKNKFTTLYKGEQQYTGKGIYTSEIVPLSRKVAIGFKDASVYSLLEIASLDQRFKDRYSSIIEFIPYIDALYLIDETTKTLNPVGYKIYPDNVNKTIRSKVATFNKVLNTLSIDEFGPIRAYINSIATRNSGISYIYPSVNCPKCHKPTDEIPATAEELVFTRYQLGALVNTSLK